MAVRAVWFVVPAGVDDPERVSGGNVYDRHVRDGLVARGWDVEIAEVADSADGAPVASVLAAVPRGGTVLIDGLVAGWAYAALEAAASRVRLVVLAHMVAAALPGVDERMADGERRALRSATRVIATSRWTASELLRRGLVEAHRVAVAVPGSLDGPVPAGSAGDLLCVGVLAPHKGQDLLLEALGLLSETHWSCTVVGSRSADPAFAGRVADAAARFGERVRMTGVLDTTGLDAAYRRSGILVAPSRAESFGMAIADARRRGLPVIASAVGGIPEAVAGGGALLVGNDDPVALAAALHRWMTDPLLRARLRDEAAHARAGVPRWSDTVAHIDELVRAV
jgi:hypothetical protein